ncbi:MAG TPA: hypothetical protein VJ796_03190 [Acidimicrobiia bacterium]|nr:hypothetical protein [Acidimicrobiia bacterium]
MSEDYILFDVPAGERVADKHFLEQLGHRVIVCNGPAPGTLCPILKGEGCQLAEGARGIVFELDLDRPQYRAILRQYKRSLGEDVPIRVVVPRDQAVEYAGLLQGLRIWSHVPVAGDLDALAAEVEAGEQ